MYAADAAHPVRSLEEKLRHLYTLRGGPTIDLTIRPAYHELLARLGDPHKKLPPVIHAAGTNGKGSTLAFLRAMLEAAEYKVHVYTSPHLRKFCERIVVAGQEISDVSLETLLDETIEANDDLKLTFFEITTALAFAAFARTPADILLLETGLGGRLDSTNVVEHPLATIITSIGFDHMEFLGSTIEQIAAEKAGIMKRGVPCIVARQTNDKVLPVLRDHAARIGCRLIEVDSSIILSAAKNPMRSFADAQDDKWHSLGLTGPHQSDNARTALAVLDAIGGFNVPQEARIKGLQNVRWPGRLQRLADPAPEWELWVDGAHNENGAQALGQQLSLWKQEDGKPLHLVIGIMQRKDLPAFLSPLLPYADSITAVPIESEPLAHTPESMAAALKNSGIATPPFAPNLKDALRHISAANPPGRILIAGSLYLAGQALDPDGLTR